MSRTAVLTLALAVLFLVFAMAGALAAPSQTLTGWSDSFADLTGIWSSTNITVTQGAGGLRLAPLAGDPAHFNGAGLATSVLVNPRLVRRAFAGWVMSVATGPGNSLYMSTVEQNTLWLSAYDPATGRWQHLAQIGYDPLCEMFGCSRNLLVASDGRVYYVQDNLYQYTPGSSQFVNVGKPNDPNAIISLAAGPGGRIYLVMGSGLWSYDPGAGFLLQTVLANAPLGVGAEAIIVGPDGKVYGGYSLGPATHLFVYDPVTHRLVEPTNTLDYIFFRGLAFGPDGRLYIAAGTTDGCMGGLLVYDPASTFMQYLAYGIGNAHAAVRGRDDKIYFTGRNCANSEMWRYDPQTRQLQDLGRFNGESGSLAAAGNGRIYGDAQQAFIEHDPAAPEVASWGQITWQAAVPAGSGLTVDVLAENGQTLISNANSGASLASIDIQAHPSIQLRASLWGDGAHTPVLQRWAISWIGAAPACPATIRSTRNGPWSNPATWDLGRIPTAGDVVQVQVGHQVEVPGAVAVRGLCNDGALLSAAGSSLSIRASGPLTNTGSIRGQAGRAGTGSECGAMGSDINLWGAPVYNAGTIRAGEGGAGSMCGGKGGDTMVLGQDTTNDGTICAGAGGDVMSTAAGARPGDGGEAHIWGKWEDYGGTLINRGLACGGAGGSANPAATGAQPGGDGGRLKLISLPNVLLSGGQAYGGRAGQGAAGGAAGRDGPVVIEPSTIALSGAGTEVRGSDVQIFGGPDWTLDLSGLGQGAVQATRHVTVGVGVGGALQAGGKAAVLAGTVLLSPGSALDRVIAAPQVVGGPGQVLRDVSLVGPGRTGTRAGGRLSLAFQLLNSSPLADQFTVSVHDNAGWTVQAPSSLAVAAIAGESLVVQVTVPESAPAGTQDDVTVTATSQSDPATTATAQVRVVAMRGIYLPGLAR